MTTRRNANNVLVIPDLHCPYHHPGAFDFLGDLSRALKPGLVICIGDEIDAHALSRYKPDPDGRSAGDEIRQARKALKNLWRLFPKAVSCESNHTWRPFKKAHDAGIPSSCLRTIRDILEAPEGWSWVQEYHGDGVCYTHGDGVRGGVAPALRLARANRCSTVIGHLHTEGGVSWDYTRSSRIYGMSVGCLIDEKSHAFAYGKFNPRRPALGAGVIEDGVPRFVPFTS